MAGTQLRRQLLVSASEHAAMLIDDVAGVYFTLMLCAQEGRVHQNGTADEAASLMCYDGRSHPSHRVSQNRRGDEPKRSDEAYDVAGMIGVSISLPRRARLAVSPRIRQHKVEFTRQ
jgi:hypothetical protein